MTLISDPITKKDVKKEGFKIGDVIRCPMGRKYEDFEIVPPDTRRGIIAVHSGNWVLLYKHWSKCELVGNVKDNPELSCAGRVIND